MANIIDYVRWRGDIPLSQVPLGEVDALVLSYLSYMPFDGLVSENFSQEGTMLCDAAEYQLEHGLSSSCMMDSVKEDCLLLEAVRDSERFGSLRLTGYVNQYDEETQFSAITFLPPVGPAFVAFRGTDSTVVGWKEDFDMSFSSEVPAQGAALDYIVRASAAISLPAILGGHSKGGNLAVFAAATCEPVVQDRVCAVYNNDGPGFTEFLLGKPGYLRMVPKIQTYIPQSSIIGILLEHEEEYTVIKSSQVSILQHEPYSWEVMGGSFREAEGMDAETVLLDKTIKAWIAGMSREERSIFVDAVFELLEAGGADQAPDLLHPKSIRALFKALNADEQTRSMLGQNLLRFLRNAAAVRAKTFRRKPDSTEISTIG